MPDPEKSADTSLTTCDAAREAAVVAVPRDRLEQVIKWMISGNREHDVLEVIAKEWPEQDVETLLVAATRDLVSSAYTPTDVVIGWCIEATRECYRQCMSIADFAGALRAIKQLADLSSRLGG